MKFLDQSRRRFRVEFPNEPELTAQFVAERFSSRETLSRDFWSEVDLLSEDGEIDPDTVRGRMMIVWLRLPDAGERPFTGLVKQVEQIEQQGSHPRKIHLYRVLLVPWLDQTRERCNSRVYLDKTREEQVAEILRDYLGVARWEWHVTGLSSEQPRYPMCVQFNETDFNQIKSRLEYDGRSTHFEHDGEGHTWVIRDTTLDAEPITGPSPEIRYHADANSGLSVAQHSITRWSRCSQWGPREGLLSSYDFKTARPSQASAPTLDNSPDVLPLQRHEFVGNGGFMGTDGYRLAVRRMEEIEVRRRLMRGHSTNPYLAAGRWFRLTGHPGCAAKPEDNDYVVNDIRYEAKNNFLRDPDSPPSFKCEFVAHPRKIVWRPGRHWHSEPHVVSVLQTATVVGRDGQGPIDVDEYGRVLLRFHWDLESRFTCRVRVQQPWLGGETGAQFFPRIGSEVTVAFEMGNPDSPLVLGALPNIARMPAWQLPSQAHLSGIRSREATPGGGNSPGSQGNHILFDDTPGKVHFQAFSSHQYSQISLGLYCLIDGNRGRGRLRGQGVEVRTDGHGVWRAALGQLNTTDARRGADSHATDIREAAERLDNAQSLHQSLSEAAQSAKAHDADDQTPVVQALQKQLGELKGSGGDPASGEFPEFQAPHMLSASAAGIQSVAEGSTHIASNEHTALTSGGHTSLSTGKSLLASSRQAVRLFAYQLGMKLISACADIDLQALKTSINLLAKLKITAVADDVTIEGLTQLTLSGGGSSITLNSGGITSKTAGRWVAHAASFDMNGPASVASPTLPQGVSLPLGGLEVWNRYTHLVPERTTSGVREGLFSALDADRSTHDGSLDGNGFRSVASVAMGTAEVTYERDPSEPWDQGSYLGEDEWLAAAEQEAMAAGSSNTSAATSAAAVAASTLQSASSLLSAPPVQQGMAAVQAVQSLQQGDIQALLNAAKPVAVAAGVPGPWIPLPQPSRPA